MGQYCLLCWYLNINYPPIPRKFPLKLCLSFDVGKTSLPFRYLADKRMFALRLEFVVTDHVAGQRMGFVMSDVEMGQHFYLVIQFKQ